MSRTELWTDGSGLATGGPGGWAFVLVAFDDAGAVRKEVERSGGIPEATNQRAEMTAVLEGLRALRPAAAVTVHTDSQYVMHGFTQGWVARWQRHGWSNRNDDPVKNQDLWEQLDAEVGSRRVSWEHVKGHQAVRRCPMCQWTGALKHRRCPTCTYPTRRHLPFPLNARCDELAGAERRLLVSQG